MLVLFIFIAWTLATLFIKSPIVVTVPRFWFSGICLGWLIIIRRDDVDSRIVAHEFIHFKQQKELFVIGAYVIYLLDFLFKSIWYLSFNKGYLYNCFEREARFFANTPDYVFKRRKFMWRHFIKMDDILVLKENSVQGDLDSVLALPKGSVFKFEGHYNTIKGLILGKIPAGQTYKFRLVQAGTSLFTLYGPQTIVVTENEITAP